MYKNLREYIDLLKAEGELICITDEVSTDLEIARITDEQCKAEGGGKALLFENNDTPFAVATNLMGSDRRIALALGTDNLPELGERIMKLFTKVTKPKNSLLDKLRFLPEIGEVSKWMPKRIKGFGECQQMVMMGDDVDLSIIPILKCAPYDGGQFITLPLVNTVDPKSGISNTGMYRMQVIDHRTTALHWHIHKTGERHYSAYKELNQIMPVSVCIGGDPSYTYSATAPLPDGIDEYMLAGFIRKKGVKLVKSITNDIYVPSDCDFVIEGYVDPSEEKFYEGPFGDHTGFYSLEDYYPKFHVTCITHRSDAIYPATIVGVPPMEDAYIAKATESIFLAPIRLVVQPEITDMWLPMEGVAHNLAIVNIEKSYIGQAQKVAASLWGAGQMMFNKFSIITSLPENKNLRNLDDLKLTINNVNISRDITIMKGTLDVLDHTSSVMGFGGKLSIDATQKPDSPTSQQPYTSIENLPTNIETTLAEQGWQTLICYCPTTTPFKQYAEQIIDSHKLDSIKFIIILNENTKEHTTSEKIWLLCSNCDAERDTYIYNGKLILDGRIKAGGINGFDRRFPNIVTLGSGSFSSKYEHLNSGESAEYKVQ